jgi:phosphate transport system substrate-binding protein
MTGAGSAFVYPILSKWSADYCAKTGDHLDYQSIGSGGGIAQIKAGTVDFGATDKPLPPDDLAQGGLGQFPVVIGGVIPVVNIPGIKPGQLKFSGAILADISLGKTTKWNDAALRAINPGVALPDADITVVHRSDGSGTTFVLMYKKPKDVARSGAAFKFFAWALESGRAQANARDYFPYFYTTRHGTVTVSA